MKVWFNAIIFLGVLLVILFILLLVYCCIKKGLCCCQKTPERADAEDNEALLDTFEEEEHDYVPYLPYTKVPSPVQPTEFNYVMTDQSDFHTSDDDLVPELPATHMSVKTYAESLDTDSQIDKGELNIS